MNSKYMIVENETPAGDAQWLIIDQTRIVHLYATSERVAREWLAEHVDNNGDIIS